MDTDDCRISARPDDDVEIEPEDITAKAAVWQRACARASSRDHLGLSADQRAALYLSADTEREELLALINAFGRQCHEVGILAERQMAARRALVEQGGVL